MSKTILQKTSFGILRTNPKLTSNVKLIADSNDTLYLESFDANDELSKSKYKGFKVSSRGDLYYDLWRFYNQKVRTTNEAAFDIFERGNSLSVGEKFGNQYDTTYGYGAQALTSRLYDEDYSLLAPLWIEPSNIPDYFIICRIEDPVSISSKNVTNPNTKALADTVSDPRRFIESYLDKATIVKTFDLTDESNLGRYIRKHANNIDFPESSILANFEKEQFFEYNGVNIDRPGFTSKKRDMYYETWPNDKTIIEYENVLTQGFSELGIIHPNIINLQFLFDDDAVDTYRFQRYFGLYVNKAEYNKFFIDGDALFQDRFNQLTQLPIPLQNNIGYRDNILDQTQTNNDGIVIYAQDPPISSLQGTTIFPNEITFQKPRIGYVRSAAGEFHKIKNDSQFSANTIRINDKSINWKDFSGFQDPENYVSAINKGVKGRPAIVIEFQNVPINDDEFRVNFVDTTDLAGLPYIDNFTMTASNTLPPGTSNSNLYSTQGSLNDIAIAFSKCVNNTNIYYPDLLSIGAAPVGSNKVVIFSRVASESWNGVKVSSFSQATLVSDVAIKFVSGQLTDYTSSVYPSSPQPFSNVIGWYATGQFVGGNNNSNAKIRVASDTTSLFSTDKYLVTNNGYSKIENIIPYIDEPIKDAAGQIIGFSNFDSYYTVNIVDTKEDISLNSSKKCSIVSLRFNEAGLFSVYPLRDFDFDFYNTQYNKKADSNIDLLESFYEGTTGPYGQTSSFIVGSTGLTGASGWITSILGPTAPFLANGGYHQLAGIGNQLDDTDTTVTNEYDRLKENEVKQLSLDSRVVPFINKWVFDDDGLDVRQNPYRLNASSAFRYPNFGPSFREFEPNGKFYTNEWLYLQKYPPYMDFEARKNSFSYFDSAINIGSTSAGSTGSTAFGLQTVSGTAGNIDYFTEYFTREMIGDVAVSTEVKYNTFSYGTVERFAETLFRGVKVTIKERLETSELQYDILEKKYRKSTKYNGYKFAAVLQVVESGFGIEVLENEKFKTITLLVKVGLMDPYWTRFGDATLGSTDPNDYFIDRTHLYTLQHRLKSNGANGYTYADFPLGGAIYHWDFDGVNNQYTIYGRDLLDATTGDILSSPNFIGEMSLNENGEYNNIELNDPTIPGVIWRISGIISASTNTIVASNFEKVPFTPPALNNTLAYTYWNPTLGPQGIFTQQFLWSQPLTYLGGGFNGYTGILQSLTFANIADILNSGNPLVEYTTIKVDGSIKKNDKVIELIKPFETPKANYLRPTEDTQVPNELDSILSGDVAGFQMGAMERAIINIMSRYNGRYQPKFNDLLYFKDYYEAGSTGAEKGPRFYGFDNFMNLEFNTSEENFGKLQNYFYNKINPENPSGVIKLSKTNLPSVYPKIGEISIDKRDLYVFLSNWDMGYYRKAIDRTTEEPTVGYQGVIENKAFLGSKIMSIPDTIRLENFTLILSDELEGGIANIDNVPESVVETIIETSTPRTRRKGEKLTPEQKRNRKTKKSLLQLDVFTTKALINYLRADGFDFEFNEYINPNFTFGETGLDDDIENYIKANIFERYEVDRIIFYENQFANNVNQLTPVELSLSNLELLKKGYKISENLEVKFSIDSPLNFKLIYNIPKLDNYSISFKVDLKKK